MTTPTVAPPNPGRIMHTLNAYQQTYALRGAIELDLFTRIAAGAATPSALAAQIPARERGVRILCDYLVVIGFLTKTGDHYALTPESALFLDRRSPAYLGAAAGFLAHDDILAHFRDMAGLVRHGGAADQGTVAPDHPIWVEFARSMGPMVTMQAQAVARAVARPGTPMKVLDIAAGHGLFGLFVAVQNPRAQVVGLDWAAVLQVARENAVKLGVADRYATIAGSAFDVDLGSGYDLVLVPNFLHHFDPPTNVGLLRRIRAATTPGGIVAIVEFVPDDSRVTPPLSAAFALTMLGSTPAGDAYTYRELDRMCLDAGYSETRQQPLEGSPQQLVLAMVR